MLFRHTRIAVAITACSFATSVLATEVVSEDIEIEDPTPALIFDDSTQPGDDWWVRGRDEYFSVVDVTGLYAMDIVRFDPVDQSFFVGYEAQATGVNAMALGFLSTATGDYSAAVGWGTEAQNYSATSLGIGAFTNGDSSLAIGHNAWAAALESTGMGMEAFAGGRSSIAIGSAANAARDADYAISVGAFSDATDNEAIALGRLAQATDRAAVAVGGAAMAGGANATALGRHATAAAENAVALGYAAYAPEPNTLVIGATLDVEPEHPVVGPPVNVAIGTTSPQAPLHVYRHDGSAQVLVEETSPEVAPRTLFTLANPGNTKFEIMNTDAMESWAFTNSGVDFRMSLQGSGQVEFRVDNNGNAYVANNMELGGTLTELSDRNQKHAIVPLVGETVLAKVAQLPVSEWSYKGEGADQRHIGPMAQDFYAAFGLASGETRISARDMAGVNMAAIQALNDRVKHLDAALEDARAENAALVAANDDLAQRLALVEHWMAAQHGDDSAQMASN